MTKKMISLMTMNRDRGIISKLEKSNFNRKIMKIQDYQGLMNN